MEGLRLPEGLELVVDTDELPGKKWAVSKTVEVEPYGVSNWLAYVKYCANKALEEAERAEVSLKARNYENLYSRVEKVYQALERMIDEARRLVHFMPRLEEEVVVKRAIMDTMPFEVGYMEEGGFKAVIPLVLPNKKHRPRFRYISESLLASLHAYFISHERIRYKHCVMVIRYVFEEGYPIQYMYDYDNVDTSDIINAMALYLMPDDKPEYFNLIQCKVVGDSNRTEIYMLPDDVFEHWFVSNKMQLDASIDNRC